MLQKSGVLPFLWWTLVQYNAYRKICLVFVFVFVFVYALRSKKLNCTFYPLMNIQMRCSSSRAGLGCACVGLCFAAFGFMSFYTPGTSWG